MTIVGKILLYLFAGIFALYVVFAFLALRWWNNRYGGDDEPTAGKRQW